jgi:hypothetical protein
MGRRMSDRKPRTAGGKVLWHLTMSLDGFMAGPKYEMDRLIGASSRPGLIDEYVRTTGAVLGAETVGCRAWRPPVRYRPLGGEEGQQGDIAA